MIAWRILECLLYLLSNFSHSLTWYFLCCFNELRVVFVDIFLQCYGSFFRQLLNFCLCFLNAVLPFLCNIIHIYNRQGESQVTRRGKLGGSWVKGGWKLGWVANAQYNKKFLWQNIYVRWHRILCLRNYFLPKSSPYTTVLGCKNTFCCSFAKIHMINNCWHQMLQKWRLSFLVWGTYYSLQWIFYGFRRLKSYSLLCPPLINATGESTFGNLHFWLKLMTTTEMIY